MVSFFRDDVKRTVFFLGVSAVSLVVSFFGVGGLPFDAAWVAILLCGAPIVKGAVEGLVTEFDVKADVLVSIALVAAVVIGEIFAAGEVAFIMAIGAFLEERTVAKARMGIEKLVNLSPTTARVVRGGKESVISADQVRVGDVLRVLAGEMIAVDGVIIKGETSVDQSVMTGESLPVDKVVGDGVQSGTVNQFGTFDMEAQKVGQDSSLQRMIRLVESADAGKAKIVGLADRWATWIVVIAVVAAVATWFVTGEVIRSVTILVVFCPCALVLATPTAIMAGIGNASRYGVLVSQGDALERLAKVKRVAFDKTGTLTYGRLSVVEVESCDSNFDRESVLRLAASAELRSEHPLGKAIVSHYVGEYGKSLDEPEGFRLRVGHGVFANVCDGHVCVGNEAMLFDMGVDICKGLLDRVEELRGEGCSVVFVVRDEEVMGLIGLADVVRDEAFDVVAAIHGLGVGTVLITGDSKAAAEHIARATGILEVRSGCLPEDKLGVIRDYEAKGEQVCMVGDGINDAPALKASLVGVAMGGIGSDIAIDAADVVLVGDDIREIPHLLALSRRVMRTINWNLAASMILNFAAIALAISGVLTPVVGALVHNVGSVAVIINSSLLLKWREGK